LNSTTKRALVLPWLCVALWACATTEPIIPKAPFVIDSDWADIVHDESWVKRPEFDWRQNFWSRIQSLPQDVRNHPEMSRLATYRPITEMKSFERGFLGKIGDTTIFGASRDRIADADRLYWVMVKVLSENYGCFMRGTKRSGNVFYFKCRDTRHIVFWRSEGRDWLEFIGRQYDASGREMVVDNHKRIFTGRNIAADLAWYRPGVGMPSSRFRLAH